VLPVLSFPPWQYELLSSFCGSHASFFPWIRTAAPSYRYVTEGLLFEKMSVRFFFFFPPWDKEGPMYFRVLGLSAYLFPFFGANYRCVRPPFMDQSGPDGFSLATRGWSPFFFFPFIPRESGIARIIVSPGSLLLPIRCLPCVKGKSLFFLPSIRKDRDSPAIYRKYEAPPPFSY